MKSAVLLATAALFFVAAQTKGEPPAQAKRGQQLFRSSEKGACIACHKLEGVGTPAGPDLSKTAAVLPPRALAMAIRATMTVYVVEVKPKVGDPFPAMKVDDLSFYDVSKNPPELRKFEKGSFETGANTKWKHPPESAGYTNEQLADVISYVRFIAAGDRKEVDPDTIQ